MNPVRIATSLRREVSGLRFTATVTHVYNPLAYAWGPHKQYLERYAQAPREILLLGMNPGPWGMAQTGVPFGDVELVRHWLAIEAPVGKPAEEHPKRPIHGFDCPRREVSGQRLWGWARDRYKIPGRFFSRFFIYNYCPLCFMEASGKNFTPDRIPAAQRGALLEACDRALERMVKHLQPAYVVGVGQFAEKRAKAALHDFGGVIGRIPHPSPASPAANRGWAKPAEEAFRALGIKIP